MLPYIRTVNRNLKISDNDRPYDPKSAFGKRLKDGKKAEDWVREVFIVKYYSKYIDAYSSEEYAEKRGDPQEWNSQMDTIYGDIVFCFKNTLTPIFKVNIKRSKENDLATAKYYGTSTDIFNDGLFTFYFSTYENYKDESHYEMIWAQKLNNEKPAQKNNKDKEVIYSREQLKRYALPAKEVIDILLKRKLEDALKKVPQERDLLICSELDSLINSRNKDLLKTNPLIGNNISNNNNNNNNNNFPIRKVVVQSKVDIREIKLYSITNKKYATISESEIQKAEKHFKNDNKDTLFILYYYTNGKTDENDKKYIYYSKIRDDIKNNKIKITNVYEKNKEGNIIYNKDSTPKIKGKIYKYDDLEQYAEINT